MRLWAVFGLWGGEFIARNTSLHDGVVRAKALGPWSRGVVSTCVDATAFELATGE